MSEPASSRQSRPLRARIQDAAIATLAGLLTLVAMAWSADLPIEFGWQIYTQQYIALILAFTLALVFLHYRADGRTGGVVPAYDAVAAAVCLVVAGYVAVIYQWLDAELPYDPRIGVPFACVLLLGLTEALRRVAGLFLTVLVLVFFCYGLLGYLIPGPFMGNYVSPANLLNSLMLGDVGILGVPTQIAATVVIAFVLFGTILNRAGGSKYFTDVALSLFGQYRGGAAKIAIVASSLFGMISGSAVSNVATIGTVTIPLMRKSGFAANTAAGVEAVASTGGQLMPPVMGAAAFLLAQDLDVPYREVVIAALIPAVLYYIALFIQADLRAARDEIARVDVGGLPRLSRVLAQGWHFPLPFVLIVVALFGLNYLPEKAGLAASGLILLLALFVPHEGQRLPLREVPSLIAQTGLAVLDIVIITAAAGVIIGVLNRTGLSFALTENLVQMVDKHLLLLLLATALISIVLGMGMPTISVYVLLAALMAPSIKALGVDPMAAHLFVLYFGMMSMITPPVAIAAFAAASLAKTNPMTTAWEAMRFGWPAYVVPFLFVYSPTLIFKGSGVAIALATVTAIAGVWLITASMVGFLTLPLAPLRRVLVGIAGLGLLIPAGAFPGAVFTDIGGALLAAVLLGQDWFVARKRRTSLQGGGAA